MFDLRGLRTDNRANAKVQEDVEHPSLVSKDWTVWDGKKKKREEDSAVKVEEFFLDPSLSQVMFACESIF